MGQSGGTRQSIRAQLNKIVLIPSITFLVLFVVLSSTTLAQAVSLRASVSDGRAGIELADALTELQQERRLGAEYLAAPEPGTEQALREAAGRTDDALAGLEELRDNLGEQRAPDLADDFYEALDAAVELREEEVDPDEEPGDVDVAVSTYTDAIHHGIQLYSSTTHALDDGSAAAEAAATTDLMWAQESFSQADALVSAALAEDELNRADQSSIAALTSDAQHRIEAVHETEHSDGAQGLSARELAASQPWQEALGMVTSIAHHEAPVSVDPLTAEQTRDLAPPSDADGWRAVADPVNADLKTLTDERAASVADATDAASTWMFSLAVGGGITALFAGTVAYGVAARSAGRLTFRLAQLRAETLGTARSDLPRIVRRLEAGDSVDLDTEMKQLDHGNDEVGQVADAFNIAQRTAVSAAVKQADIRAGANRVFLGIAHRNQSLVQRQLQLLDRVEREEEDPDLLESLFQLDHLATRGRRHAENLIILGGAQPGRRWRHPIPLIDILRGAISETEEYARVRLTSTPDLALSGAVVADVIHLLAELVENATAYSSPKTEVTIATETVPKGVAIEIEDRGLGMTDDALVQANTTLSEAPEFDVMAPETDARLGLFVVARLADKHSIGVQLRPSPHGGTRAVVLLPGALIVSSAGNATEEERPRTGRAARQGSVHQPAGGQGDLGATGASRPVLRPVPLHDDGAAATPGQESSSGGPVLHRFPDATAAPGEDRGTGSDRSAVVEQRTTRAPGESPPPLPRRKANTGRVGVGPGRAGLPKRRRQASLAPQLRQENTPHQEEEADTSSEHRSPEQARRMMNAFSAGTQRGRAEDVESSVPKDSGDDPAGVGTDDHTGESD